MTNRRGPFRLTAGLFTLVALVLLGLLNNTPASLAPLPAEVGSHLTAASLMATAVVPDSALSAPMLEGQVFRGQKGDERQPLAEVEVQLYCSNDPHALGTLCDRTSTNGIGWYGLVPPGIWEYYNIFEVDPAGYVSEFASSVDGAVVNLNWIQYTNPLAG